MAHGSARLPSQTARSWESAAARQPGRPAPRRGPGPKPPLETKAALLWSGALLTVGAVVDEATGAGLGWIYVLSAALAAALVALACARPGTWWVPTVPPPAVAAVAVCAQLLAEDSHGQGKAAAAVMTEVLRWANDTFPAMAAAEATVLTVLVTRTIRSGRGGRTGHA